MVSPAAIRLFAIRSSAKKTIFPAFSPLKASDKHLDIQVVFGGIKGFFFGYHRIFF
jgi:F0F1-type ATP synthase beta subunit